MADTLSTEMHSGGVETVLLPHNRLNYYYKKKKKVFE